MIVAFRENRTLGIREGIGFGAAFPWPTCSPAYASPAVSPRPAQGWLPARAGSPLAGRDSHPLDNEQSFMEVSHPPIPFDPQGLVALKFLSVLPLDTSSSGMQARVVTQWQSHSFDTAKALGDLSVWPY
jgi:hypothetical protein